MVEMKISRPYPRVFVSKHIPRALNRISLTWYPGGEYCGEWHGVDCGGLSFRLPYKCRKQQYKKLEKWGELDQYCKRMRKISLTSRIKDDKLYSKGENDGKRRL